jgi:hypothetical protein
VSGYFPGQVLVSRHGKHEGLEVTVQGLTAGGNVVVKPTGSNGAGWNGRKSAGGPWTLTVEQIRARYESKSDLVTSPKGAGRAFRRIAPPKESPVPTTIKVSAEQARKRPAHSDPNYRVENVTPDMAAAWLKHMGTNRKLSLTLVRQYAAAMRRGEWLETSEAVKQDTNGLWRDGQHRLSAIVESGMTVRMLVARDVPAEAFDVMDTGRKRTGGDVLSMHGYINTDATASTARLLTFIGIARRPRLNSRLDREQAPTTAPAILDYVEAHPEVVSGVAMGYRAYGAGLKGGPGLWGAAFALFLRVAPYNVVDDFATGIATGAGLGAGSPVLWIRNHTLGAPKGSFATEPEREILLAKIVKAWNAHRKGRTLRSIRWNPETDLFPEAK